MPPATDFPSRLIRRSDLVACESAFIDYRIPGCHPKHNYALIGPGVAQGSKQFVNLAEPHGFNLGAVNVPHGVTNPMHLHYTAEVFICFRGDWAVQWGGTGGPEATIGEGDLVSVPTWIYRGFRNVGVDDGFLFTVLGGDQSGGILWAPDVVQAGQENGLFLTDDDRIIDTVEGESLATDDRLFVPMTPAEMASLPQYPPAAMARNIVRQRDLAWSTRALLGAIDAGIALAPAVGFGMTEDVAHRAPVMDPWGFSIAWVRAAPGATIPAHRLAEKQVLVAYAGTWRIDLQDADASAAIALDAWDTYSVPAGAWRAITNTGTSEALLLVVNAGDARTRIEWRPDVVAAADARGYAIDANGFLAAKRFLRLHLLEKRA